MSLALASKSFLKFSACLELSKLPSRSVNFVTPSTSFATSFPKFELISSIVAEVSSIVSWSNAHTTVVVSNFNPARIPATSIG